MAPTFASPTTAVVRGVHAAQTVKSTDGTLLEIIVSNGAGAAGSVTIADSNGTRFVVNVGANDTTNPLDLNLTCVGEILVTPSADTLDVLIKYV
jgi:hypothetical protein